jgi:aminoglycoside 3'-phosphotransferase-2
LQLPSLPLPLTYLERDYDFHQVLQGRSSASVYRLERAGRPCLFLKAATESDASALRGEAERLGWLHGRLPVPELIEFAENSYGAYLLTSIVPGDDLTSFNKAGDDSKRRMTVLLGEALAMLHEVDAADCPFLHSVEHELARVKQLTGVAEEGDMSALLLELQSAAPPEVSQVLTHGDACLPNVLVLDDRLSGFVDLGSAGLGDPYRDLAQTLWSLEYNYGPGWEEEFLEAYGMAGMDRGKLDYYLKLSSLL